MSHVWMSHAWQRVWVGVVGAAPDCKHQSCMHAIGIGQACAPPSSAQRLLFESIRLLFKSIQGTAHTASMAAIHPQQSNPDIQKGPGPRGMGESCMVWVRHNAWRRQAYRMA